ncbi:uncharacterized protein CC84DRAFT_1251427 [Paraphaeosphaeria sporulosa]|uniref:Uncharacterized protein n=1 Tax=Paraphaeosphaeria sporulosa TaxID=1460663 RepID=A0A177C662_9PLEO|nr:uncharacterized protein CC84DRAFT_1251427 [Paraphaeosphaeria sporulosa]OAG03244.1 hypothetical protein CC84DRAFT_1251427 [Paraphaeosphaeria sporulosa]
MPYVETPPERTSENGDYGHELDDVVDGGLIEPIAIIGFSLKAPGDASTADAFWDMLVEGRSGASDFPRERINIESFSQDGIHRSGDIPMRRGHFIKDDIQAFDAGFFSISHTEARAMDPMQRLLLETAYHGFENAGIPMHDLVGSNTSVYTGCFTTDYLIQLTKDPLAIPTYAATGTGASILANRISWFFDLKGPSVNMDSACSSSGMALDLACENLRNGSTRMSLVGGCNLTFSAEYFTMLTNLNMLSKDGQSHSFDSRANGYARGEGFGTVVLKRMSDAIADGDTIRAVIRSTGCNHDGKTPGITQPSSEAQEQLVRETYRKGGLSMIPTRFCETHGTGTSLGDPIESMALGRAFQDARSPADPLILGALKSNIGHLEGASGIAGLIKAVMVLENGLIPPNYDFESLNPKIDAEYLGIQIPERVMAWPSNGLRRASVNSFGFGGSNSHVVLDDAYNYLRLRGLHANHRTVVRPSILAEVEPEIPRSLFFSADTGEALERVLSTYQGCFTEREFHIGDLAYTLDSRRSHLPWRSCLTVTSPEDLMKLSSRSSVPRKVQDKKPRLGFVFTGQGAQWFGMGRELMSYPTFAESVKRSDKHLKSIGCPWSTTTMFASTTRLGLDDPVRSQTLCTVLQVALVDLLAHCGVKPSAVVGHSSGEIAAAYAAGAISREAAWSLAYMRGYHAQTLPSRTDYRGSMIAVGLSEEDARPYLEEVIRSNASPWALRVACYNSPRSITVSGPSDQVDNLETILDEASVFNRVLRVPVAYHSPQMEVIAAEYGDSIGAMQVQELRIPMVSSVTGMIATAKQLQRAQYWVDNMVSAVRFDEAVEALTAVSPKTLTKKLDRSHLMMPAVDLLVEIGPHTALKGPVLDILKKTPRASEVDYDFAISRNVSAAETVHHLIGRLHCKGLDVDLRQINDPIGTPRAVLTNLPAYPFDKSQTFWYESRMNKDYRLKEHGHQEFLGSRSLDWCSLAPQWRYFIRTKELPWTEDHKINGATLYPASGMIVMAAEAARQMVAPTGEIKGYQLRNVTFSTALNIPPSRGELEARIGLRPSGNIEHAFEFILYSVQSNNGWVENSRGEIQVYLKAAGDLSDALPGLDASQASLTCDESLDTESFYQYLWEMGYGYGPAFQLVQDIHHDSKYGKVLGHIKPLVTTVSKDSIVHPATLDAIMHLEFAILFKAGTDRPGTFIPTKIDNLWMSDKGLNVQDSLVTAVTTVQSRTQRHARGSCQVFSPDFGQTLLRAEGIELTMVASSNNKSLVQPGSEHVLSYVCSEVDVDMLNAEQLKAYLAKTFPTEYDPVVKRKAIRDFVLLSLQNLDSRLASLNLSPSTPHGRAYVEWAKSLWQRPDIVLPDASLSELEEEVLKHGTEGRMIVEVNKGLLDIVLDHRPPHELLFGPDRLLPLYYEEKAKKEVYFRRLVHYVSLLAHKRPNLRILEIGGGTGTFTSYILEALSVPGDDGSKRLRCMSYDFTDIGPAFIDQAKSRYVQYGSKMKYNILNIEDDPERQGFRPESYDIIIAISVLHATRNLGETLANTRRLLKPGGRLLLQEPTTPEDPSHFFVFGVFPGWWLGVEEYRRLCPLVDQPKWDLLMKENGFTGTDIVLRDYEMDDAHQMDFLICQAAASDVAAKPTIKQAVSLIVDSGSAAQLRAAETVRNTLLATTGTESEIVALSELMTESEILISTCISLLDFDGPFMTSMSEQQYDGLQQLLKKAKLLVWVSRGGGDQPHQPGFQMIDGFARSFRLEAAFLKLVHLALEPSEILTADQADAIVQVLDVTNASDNYEHEVTEKGGYLHVQRVVPQPALRQEFLSRMRPQRTIQRQATADLSVQLDIDVPAQLDTLAFTTTANFSGPLGFDEVEIQVRAVGLSHEDHLIAIGRSEARAFGRDCAGVVTRVGEGCKLQPGQRVWMYASGRCGSTARSSMHAVVFLPESISFDQACALPSDVVTAAHALHAIARLEVSDAVLLDCAGSLLHSALVTSNSLGLNVFVLAHSHNEKLVLEQETGLPPSHVLVLGTPFQHQFKALNGGQGADAVISTRADPACADVLSTFGTYVHVANDGQLPKIPFSASNLTFVNLDIAALAEARPRLLQPSLQIAVNLAAAVKQDDVHTYPASDLGRAFERLGEVEHGKKVILTFGCDDRISTKVLQTEAYTFGADGTYVLTGAFGGLGVQVVRWLASKGAKYMILLSRSGPRTEQALKLVAELQAMGITLAMPTCSVTDAEAVKKAVRDGQKGMPPIRGCVHLAISGKDKSFEYMSYPEWVDRTSAKVQGTDNIYAALPSDLDFFIMTASVGGMAGLISMCAYSAGNAYQDNFARYLYGKGQKAIAMDYGAAQDIGMLAGQDLMYDRLIQTGQYTPVTSRELVALLEYYCDPAVTVNSVEQAQPIIGIEPPGRRIAQGKDVPEGMKHSLWLNLYDMDDSLGAADAVDTGTNARSANLKDSIDAAASVSEAEHLIVDALIQRVAKTTSMPPEKMEAERPIHSYGVDSLTAIDLRNWIASVFEYDIAVFEILGEATFRGVGESIARKLKEGK